MTIYQFQKDMAEEIEQLMTGMVFKDPQGKPAHMTSYLQSLPKREQTVQPGSLMADDEGEDDDDPYPFCIVRLEQGGIYAGAQRVKVILVFGIFDDDRSNLGHQTLLNVMHRVAERFIGNPILKDMYQMDINAGIDWILNDEECYPYFIGGLEMVWDAYFINREEDRYV